jgi:hypothetical protein
MVYLVFMTAAVIIYPNPFHDKTTVVFDNTPGQIYRATLTSFDGKQIRQISDISNGTFDIFRDELPAGIYYLEVWGDTIFRRKIMIR